MIGSGVDYPAFGSQQQYVDGNFHSNHFASIRNGFRTFFRRAFGMAHESVQFPLEITMDTVEKEALGRPFSLGMLYDCRSDRIVPGMSLWDRRTLEEHIQRQPMPNSNFTVVSDDTIADKATALGVKGDLKVSVLGGLVNLEGASSYFWDSKDSSENARATLKYESKSHFDQLNVQLSPDNIKYPEALRRCNATHVVTGIEWGADAFFVFEKSSHTVASSHEMHDRLAGIVKNISTELKATCTGDLKRSDSRETENISCNYHGDFQLETIPTTYKEALHVIKTLPDLVKKNHPVPKRVYLYPLCMLDSGAVRVVHSISETLVDRVECILQKYMDCHAKVTPISKSSAVAAVPFLQQDLDHFKHIINLAAKVFKEELMPLLTAVRSGAEQENKLSSMLSQWETSAASPHNFGMVLIGIEYTVVYIENLLTAAKEQGIPEAFGPDRYRITSAIDKGAIVCFTFNADVLKSKGLKLIRKYLSRPAPLPKEWHHSHIPKTAIKETFCLFLEYAKNNKGGDRKIDYVITDGEGLDSEHPVIVQVFNEGRGETITLANAPGKPYDTGESSGSPVHLWWPNPTKGAETVQSYIVWHFPSGSKSGEWKLTGQKDVIIMRSGTKCLFKVEAMTKAGISPTSPVSEPVLAKNDGWNVIDLTARLLLFR